MVERLILVALLVALSGGAYVAWQQWQRRRLTPLTRSIGEQTVLYFRSDACATCATQSRFLTQLREAQPVTVETIDAHAEPQRAADFGVMTLPTTIVVSAQGTVKQINYGLTSATQLARQLQN